MCHETIQDYAFDVIPPRGFAIIIVTKNKLDKIMAAYLAENNGEQNDGGRSWNRGDGQRMGVDPTYDNDTIWFYDRSLENILSILILCLGLVCDLCPNQLILQLHL